MNLEWCNDHRKHDECCVCARPATIVEISPIDISEGDVVFVHASCGLERHDNCVMAGWLKFPINTSWDDLMVLLALYTPHK